MTTEIPRNEYPRPQFQREDWLNLNGVWRFDFDDEDVGVEQKWYQFHAYTKEIVVPFAYQCKMSGIGLREFHDIVWYSKTVTLPETYEDKCLLLHFGAVDYRADVWVNGEHVMTHEGGHVPFEIDISKAVSGRQLEITVRAQDYARDLELPRGKQYWKEESDFIFYTGITGIWQTVWLEAVSKTSLKKIWITPDIDRKSVSLEYEIAGAFSNKELNVEIYLAGEPVAEQVVRLRNNKGKYVFWLDQELILDWKKKDRWLWSPKHPVLFDMRLSIFEENVLLDQVTSYFAFRKVSVENGKFCLNNRPFYQKLILDQGYWEDSLLTAPSDEHFQEDIRLCQEMGFNGARKHQKLEDPRYLYWADRMGFLVWSEMANAYNYSKRYVKRMTTEWMEAIERDYNHPCIVAWVPLNESWGVEGLMNNKEEQAHATAMYWLTKSLDQTRLVISNDGWDHTKSDLLTLHDYESKRAILEERYKGLETVMDSNPSGRGLFAKGWAYEGQPILVSEMGGIAFQRAAKNDWGYSYAGSDADLIRRYYDVITPILRSKVIQGFCYTQLTDVEKEVNGLLTYSRQKKLPLEVIRAINEGVYELEEMQD